jgi:uncharacterized membrane protein
MKPPPFLIGFTFIPWCMQTENWLIGVGIAVLLEMSYWVPFRLEIAERDFQKIWYFCLLSTVGVFIYFYTSSTGTAPSQVFFISQKGSSALTKFMTWLPLIFFPLALAQAFSEKEKIPFTAFISEFQKKKLKISPKSSVSINLLFPYLVLCLLSASTINIKIAWFYPAACLILGWGLWRIRPKRYSAVIWGSLMVAVFTTGYFGGVGWYSMAKFIDNQVSNMMFSFLQRNADPMKSRTAIGEISSLKMSGKILMRVQYEKGHTRKILLPQNGYNIYKSSVWYSSKAPFKAISPVSRGDDLVWPLQKTGSSSVILNITGDLADGAGFIVAPSNALKVEDLPIEKMSINPFGSIRVEGGQKFIEYKIHVGGNKSIWSIPGEKDLSIPDKLDSTLATFAEKLKLNSLSRESIPETINEYFQTNFAYTLSLKRVDKSLPPLADFLINTKAGHCEYFATATVLLLRKAGLHARYIYGYSAHEYDWEKKGLVVRTRNTHAWAVAFINGKWINVDTTPSNWIDKENEDASAMEGVGDLWSWMVLIFSKWRYSEDSGNIVTYLLVILIPLLIYMLFRIVKQTKIARKEITSIDEDLSRSKLKEISEFYRIEQFLLGKGLKRCPWETYGQWVNRIEQEPASELNGSLEELLQTYYTERFDPEGINKYEQETFRNQVDNWLQKQSV